MTSRTRRPNILWLCADQQRFDTLGCYGNPFVRTPNLDRLARSGALFTNCFSQSPVCTPSRACFLTGRYPRTTGARQNGQAINPTERLVPRILADSGYTCGLAGKLHLAPCEPTTPDRYERRIDDGYSVFAWSHDPRPLWPGNDYIAWLRGKGVQFSTPERPDCRWVQTGMPEEHHQTTWCADRAIAFMRSMARRGDPWLFSVNFFDPHHPFDPPANYLERYLERLDSVPLPAFDPAQLERAPGLLRTSHDRAYNAPGLCPYRDMSPHDHRLIRAAYWAMCDLLDTQIGRILQALEDTGQLENTIVLYHSDHGELLGDHGAYLKGPHLYDCCVHVPLIASWPAKIPAGFSTDTLVELTDLAPTLLDLCGLPVSPAMQGLSLAQCLRDADPKYVHRNCVICEYYNAAPFYWEMRPYATMLRTSTRKLVAYHGSETGELFDLAADPQEQVNLWDDPSQSGMKLALFKELCDRIAWTADPLPEREAHW